jgi:hypothetical protein
MRCPQLMAGSSTLPFNGYSCLLLLQAGIVRQASARFISFSVNVPVRPAAERKRGALPPSRMPAASTKASR